MKCEAKTEAEMREATAPTPKDTAELGEYIKNLVEREHDYGTCVYAMSLAAVAAFNHVARALSVTGFQASCADLNILRHTRNISGPFIILSADKMLYPQYDLVKQLEEAMGEWKEWAAGEAKKKLAETDAAHPDVTAHWENLAAFTPNAQVHRKNRPIKEQECIQNQMM